MIEYNLDTEHSILHVQPKSAIENDDFVKLAKAVDPHIEATGGLAGLIIETPGFPGWRSLGAMVNQFRFVRDHHKRIKRIGGVTDSHMGDVAEHFNVTLCISGDHSSSNFWTTSPHIFCGTVDLTASAI